MATAPAGFVPIAPELLTGPRLRLRQWTDADYESFAALNADPEVMAHFHAPMSRDQSDGLAHRIRNTIDERGWGFWAAEVHTGPDRGFIGFIGLNIPAATDLPFQPCVEIGWRLSRAVWGQGLATEGARMSLRIGFEVLGLDEIVAMTQLRNQRSRAVMERLGMREAVGEEFEHPLVPAGSHARASCLYRLPRTRWATTIG